VVRSAADASNQNEKVSCKSDVQESIKLLTTKPILIWKDSHHNYESIKNNNDVSTTTRSKTDCTDKHVGSRIRFKIYSVNK
jgi:hypothetical protein